MRLRHWELRLQGCSSVTLQLHLWISDKSATWTCAFPTGLLACWGQTQLMKIQKQKLILFTHANKINRPWWICTGEVCASCAPAREPPCSPSVPWAPETAGLLPPELKCTNILENAPYARSDGGNDFDHDCWRRLSGVSYLSWMFYWCWSDPWQSSCRSPRKGRRGPGWSSSSRGNRRRRRESRRCRGAGSECSTAPGEGYRSQLATTCTPQGHLFRIIIRRQRLMTNNYTRFQFWHCDLLLQCITVHNDHHTESKARKQVSAQIVLKSMMVALCTAV